MKFMKLEVGFENDVYPPKAEAAYSICRSGSREIETGGLGLADFTVTVTENRKRRPSYCSLWVKPVKNKTVRSRRHSQGLCLELFLHFTLGILHTKCHLG